MKARQNPLTQLESFIQRLVEGPFARIFPSRLEPVEITRKLERALEDNARLVGEGRRLAPNVYDIYLSIKDHQQFAASQNLLTSDWQNHLIEFARQRHYTLRTVPIIRLHSDTTLHTGIVRVETQLVDRQSGNADGVMATQALSAEQMALIRAQMAAGNALTGSSPNQPPQPTVSPSPQHIPNQPAPPPMGGFTNPNLTAQRPMPQAWLTIRQSQSNPQIYRIEKPIINIGRQLSNDIIVEDKRVSRYHAQLKYQADGQFVIFDLGSTNGITINGTPGMRQHVLRNGDRFTIGSYDFYFERR